MTSVRRLALAGLLLALPAPAAAQLVTSAAGFVSPQSVDLSGQATGSYNFYGAPVALPGGVTFTANTDAVFGQGSYGLGGNGTWGGSTVYAGVDAQFGAFRFTFSSPLTSVGAFMNYVPDGTSIFIRALDQSGGLLAEYDLAAQAPIGTPGQFNGGAFRGIVRAEGDIYAFEVANAYAVATDITFATAQVSTVPEPATVLLVAGGLAGIGALRLRRRHTA